MRVKIFNIYKIKWIKTLVIIALIKIYVCDLDAELWKAISTNTDKQVCSTSWSYMILSLDRRKSDWFLFYIQILSL